MMISFFDKVENIFRKEKKRLVFGSVSQSLFSGVVSSLDCVVKGLTVSQTSPGFYVSFENSVGKGEIAHNEQFLLFPQCFLPVWRTICHFHQI